MEKCYVNKTINIKKLFFNYLVHVPRDGVWL